MLQKEAAIALLSRHALFFSQRIGMTPIGMAVEVIFFAAIGIAALVMLATSATTGLTNTRAWLAVTFVSLMGILSVCVILLKKSGLNVGI